MFNPLKYSDDPLIEPPGALQEWGLRQRIMTFRKRNPKKFERVKPRVEAQLVYEGECMFIAVGEYALVLMGGCMESIDRFHQLRKVENMADQTHLL